MSRLTTPFRLLVAAMALAVVLSFLPTRFLGWTDDVASIVQMPAIPFSHLGMKVQTWMLSDPVETAAGPGELEHLRRELDEFRVLFLAEQQRANELQSQVEQLQRARIEGLETVSELQVAGIVGRNTGSGGESFMLNVGEQTNPRLAAGAIAVYNGAHLVGRIGSVARITSTMIPITDPSIGYVRAFTSPADSGSQQAGRGRILTLLEPQSNGTLIGDLARDARVAVGDYVHLDDPAWPATAQSMILGIVESVEQKDQNPLMERIVVRPQYAAGRLASVTIKIESPGAPGSPGGPGGPGTTIHAREGGERGAP